MGKAQIMSGGDDGLYQLKLLFDTTRSQDKIDRFTNTIDNTSPGTFPHEAAIVNRARVVANAPDDETVSAWCADYTEDLSGDVGTIEIPGERQRPVIIRPGYNGRATYDFRRDGQLTPVAAMTGAAAFLAAAMLPGWQKWQPQYRVGIIIDRRIAGTGFLFDVALDDEHSTARNLSVNVSNNLVDVPAEYMDIGSLIFDVGDRVVIEFITRDYQRPRIIGFESHPRRADAIFYVKVTRGDGTIMTDDEDDDVLFSVEDSNEEALFVNQDYDDDPGSATYQYWKVRAYYLIYKEIDPDGYWLTIGCADSVPSETQYPFRYKEADKGDTDDLIPPGIYDAAVPYWVTEYESTIEEQSGAESMYELYLIGNAETQYVKETVKSSIPYRVISTVTRTEEYYRWLWACFVYYNPEEVFVWDWGSELECVSDAIIEGEDIYQEIDGVATSVTNQEETNYYDGSISGREHTLSVTSDIPATIELYGNTWYFRKAWWIMPVFDVTVQYDW